MDTFETFRQELQHALMHLYDPNYEAAEVLYEVLSCAPERGPEAIQHRIIQFIKSMKPDQTIPLDSRARRQFDLLHWRFLLGLTQEKTAEQMHVSVRTVQRMQRETEHLLARRLWERNHTYPGADQNLGTEVQSAEGREWYSQVRQELLSLQKDGPAAVADLEKSLQGALRIAQAATDNEEVSFEIEGELSDIEVRFHPSVLREVLLAVLMELERMASSGSVEFSARRIESHVELTITIPSAAVAVPVEVPLAKELLSMAGGSIQSYVKDNQVSLIMQLPAALQPRSKVVVLAIDDNADVIMLYKSYCAGSRYEIVHIEEGQHAFQSIEAIEPDIILLDVILRDIDGWDLLLDLHASPKTRSLPVIVCSVVTDEELALRLGATVYLRKPVWRGELINAFDKALRQVKTDAHMAKGA